MDNQKLSQGIDAYKVGNRGLAKQILTDITEEEPTNENAWLWLAACQDDNHQKEFCFTRVLEINPENESAKRALSIIKKPSPPSLDELLTKTSKFDSYIGQQSKKNQGLFVVQSLNCPMCGASIHTHDRDCKNCGSTLIITSLDSSLSLPYNSELLNETEKKWREILLKDPNNPDANYALGITYLHKRLRDAALEYLKKAAILAPTSPIVNYNLALAYFNDGNNRIDSIDYDNAMKSVDTTLRLDPDFPEARAFKSFFIARKLHDVNTSAAINEYQKAISFCPDIAALHNNLGLLFVFQKKYAQAESSLKKAVEIDSQYGIAYSNLTLLCIETHRDEDGVKYGQKAIEYTPMTSLNLANAYNNLALCLWKTGQKKAAVEMVNKAIAIEPQNHLYRKNLKTIRGPSIFMYILMILAIISCFFITYGLYN